MQLLALLAHSSLPLSRFNPARLPRSTPPRAGHPQRLVLTSMSPPWRACRGRCGPEYVAPDARVPACADIVVQFLLRHAGGDYPLLGAFPTVESVVTKIASI